MNVKPEEQPVVKFCYIPEEGNAEFYRKVGQREVSPWW